MNTPPITTVLSLVLTPYLLGKIGKTVVLFDIGLCLGRF